ncbi:hypothetical protein NG796_22335 [Laspinema sp. A4]|uniref:hypothetical protein n=1 Tax=Laspinema sp. D2d TaxID=2953686 RepID=UPI0021BA61F8|nr:hypothetical protein [Laspinema sp. D2d]MCT7986020.1 hypothetical protein [Laspinema sp. D2d]
MPIFEPVAIIRGFNVIRLGCKHLPGRSPPHFFPFLGLGFPGSLSSSGGRTSLGLSGSCPLFPMPLPLECSGSMASKIRLGLGFYQL